MNDDAIAAGIEQERIVLAFLTDSQTVALSWLPRSQLLALRESVYCLADWILLEKVFDWFEIELTQLELLASQQVPKHCC